MRRFLRNRRLILRLHYYLGTHILGASRGGPCDSTALVMIVGVIKHAFGVTLKTPTVQCNPMTLGTNSCFPMYNLFVLQKKSIE